LHSFVDFHDDVACNTNAPDVCEKRLFIYLLTYLVISTNSRNIGWWNFGGRCIVQKFRPSSKLGAHPPGCALPKNVALDCDVGKISARFLVYSIL